jgi:lipoate-protein ligase A
VGLILPYTREDDLVEQARATGRALCRVYRPQETCVVLGRGGSEERELRRAAIDADGVPVYRRPGGGGAVVLDDGNLVVVLALPLPGLGAVTAAFRLASDLVIGALTACGVPDVEQRGVSDLALGDRKLGGSCLRRERGLVHYATTLLVDPRLELMDRYLQHPPREPEYRKGRPHSDFVTSLTSAGYNGGAECWTAPLESALQANLPGLR